MGAFDAIGKVKELVSLVQQIDNIELYRKILDLQNEVQALSGDLLKFEERLRAKDKEIESLKERLTFRAHLIHHNNLYFETDADGDAVGYAYCTRCWEVEQKPVHVQQNPKFPGMSRCPQCKSEYNWWGKANRNKSAT
jgi:L-fucose isomerase-like protein